MCATRCLPLPVASGGLLSCCILLHEELAYDSKSQLCWDAMYAIGTARLTRAALVQISQQSSLLSFILTRDKVAVQNTQSIQRE